MSDFGNAEVLKLARKFDPEGKRTFGVVTKCDDAARAEYTDVVDKVLMRRPSDVKLKLGFHCVVNRSQKNIEEGMTHDEIWEKETKLFQKTERFKMLPEDCWGTLKLMERVGRIQETRVDECLPKLKESVRAKVEDLQLQLRQLPSQPETEGDRHHHLNTVLHSAGQDIQRRVRAEFMSSDDAEREFAIAPRIAEMVVSFRAKLRQSNPSWLEQDMIDKVTRAVTSFVNGYTVDNLVGPAIFVGMVKRIFVEERLLAAHAEDLAQEVADHLKKVLSTVIESHSCDFPVLQNSLVDVADEVINESLAKAQGLCEELALAQQVTSTTHSDYMISLSKFKKSWFEKSRESALELLAKFTTIENPNPGDVLPKEFIAMVQEVPDEPRKMAVLEICASLHVFTNLLIETFTDMAAKVIKFNMVEQLAEHLEVKSRTQFHNNLEALFPVDFELQDTKLRLQNQLNVLRQFKQELATLRTGAVTSRHRVRALGQMWSSKK